MNRAGTKLDRWEGCVFLGFYLAYVVFLVLDATGHRAKDPFVLVMLVFVGPLVAVTLATITLRQRRRQVGREEPARQEPARQEPARQEPARQEPARQEPLPDPAQEGTAPKYSSQTERVRELGADLVIASGTSRGAGDSLYLGHTLGHMLEQVETTMVLAITPGSRTALAGPDEGVGVVGDGGQIEMSGQ